MDKLNNINFKLGSVNNDLFKEKAKKEPVENEQKPVAQPKVECKNVDPDKVLDAMKKHGVHNLNHVVASGKVASKSITDSMDFFTSAISPETHRNLTEKVKTVFQQEFPSAQMDPEVIAEVVDNIIFETLTA